MKHLVWFLLRHDRLPKRPWLRRMMLRSIFKPAVARDQGLEGWYDLGPELTVAEVARFKAWHDTESEHVQGE